ncbi:MAG: hypothetical protein HON98_09185 [Chloroflexi bacterium]|nr:hypothetical protein [Chloroflexota bacterium]MBT3668959.1 hypothetical protein [Chloroflexota bacterium]MBT4002117.1 hypothetical protein [Chloroflexota bacterium]MBT4533307.1 hypothetical protein [Chloroflexota bacterium]MBT4683637.1 hypothetical protein [Chloroflexota bacterium]
MQRKQLNKPLLLLLIFVSINLLVGIIIVPDFGRSTDESVESTRAELAINMYSGNTAVNPFENYEQLGHSRYYGTAISGLVSVIEQYVFPNEDHSTKVFAHFTQFLFFQAAIIGLFLLSRFFFDGWISLSLAILFATQPLLFGHAFINPKDIPLLTTFLFTIIVGFSMVDNWLKDNNNEVVIAKKTTIFHFLGIIKIDKNL